MPQESIKKPLYEAVERDGQYYIEVEGCRIFYQIDTPFSDARTARRVAGLLNEARRMGYNKARSDLREWLNEGK